MINETPIDLLNKFDPKANKFYEDKSLKGEMAITYDEHGRIDTVQSLVGEFRNHKCVDMQDNAKRMFYERQVMMIGYHCDKCDTDYKPDPDICPTCNEALIENLAASIAEKDQRIAELEKQLKFDTKNNY